MSHFCCWRTDKTVSADARLNRVVSIKSGAPSYFSNAAPDAKPVMDRFASQLAEKSVFISIFFVVCYSPRQWPAAPLAVILTFSLNNIKFIHFYVYLHHGVIATTGIMSTKGLEKEKKISFFFFLIREGR